MNRVRYAKSLRDLERVSSRADGFRHGLGTFIAVTAFCAGLALTWPSQLQAQRKEARHLGFGFWGVADSATGEMLERKLSRDQAIRKARAA